MGLGCVREMIDGDKAHFPLSFPHSCIFGEFGEERLEESLEEKEEELGEVKEKELGGVKKGFHIQELKR